LLLQVGPLGLGVLENVVQDTSRNDVVRVSRALQDRARLDGMENERSLVRAAPLAAWRSLANSIAACVSGRPSSKPRLSGSGVSSAAMRVSVARFAASR
jgi:hypothetical protein